MRPAILPALLLPLVAACSEEAVPGGVTQDPLDVRSTDPALAQAQAWLASEVAAQPGQLRASFRSPPVELPVPCVIDLESGSRSEGELEFVRLTTDGDRMRCERVVYRTRSGGRAEPSGRAERASAPLATFRHLLDVVRVLPGLTVLQSPNPTDGDASSEFFRLVRIHGAEGAQDFESEYAGRLGELGAPEFAGPRAVVARASSILRALDWDAVPQGKWRTTHFTDAFVRTRERLGRPGRDWLTEVCVEALAWFGAPPAAESVRWLRQKAARIEPRVLARMQILSEDPDRYLDGPPQELPDE